MIKTNLLFISVLLLQFCKSPIKQNNDITAIYALTADSIIKEYNKESLTVFIQNTTHMEYKYTSFNDTLFHYFKYDLPETDSTMVISFVNNNLNSSKINVDDIINHTYISNVEINVVQDNPVDLRNDDYLYALNLKLSAVGFTEKKLGAVTFYEMTLNKKGWDPGGEIGYFLFKKVGNNWQVINKRVTSFIN